MGEEQRKNQKIITFSANASDEHSVVPRFYVMQNCRNSKDQGLNFRMRLSNLRAIAALIEVTRNDDKLNENLRNG